MKQEDRPIHSVKLQAAAAEIQAILEKHDIAGIALLHENGLNDEPGRMQHVLRLDPSYSIAYLEGKSFKTKKFVITDDEEQKKKNRRKAAATVNMLANLACRLGQIMAALRSGEMFVRQEHNIAVPKPPGKNGSIVPFNPQ